MDNTCYVYIFIYTIVNYKIKTDLYSCFVYEIFLSIINFKKTISIYTIYTF